MATANKIPPIPINFPGFTGMVLSRLFIEGQPVEDLQALYALNTKAFGGSKWNDPNRFWATPPRPGNAKNRDVLEVKLSAPQRINRFRFQAANFPCRIWLQYWNVDKGAWLAVRRQKTGDPVQITISKSVPHVIHDNVFDQSHLHPQHRGAGHWSDYSILCKTIKAARIRLVLSHLPNRNVPVDNRNQPVDYSLGIQDLQFGYRVRQWSDIPKIGPPTQSEADFTSFSTSNDLLGSPVEFGMRLYRPSDILWPMRQAQEGVAPADRQDNNVWKCEPQPFPFCVVNFYVDGRDEHGGPQSVDRFYIEPTTNGVTANLYYSNDIPDYSSAKASDDEIQYPGVSAAGVVVPVKTGLMLPDQGLLNDPSAAVGYLDLRRQMIQWAFDQPWWMGLTFRPQFASTDTGIYVILDSPGVTVIWDGGTAPGPVFRVQVHNVTFLVDFDPFVSRTLLSMVVAYDGEQASVRYRVGTDPTDPTTVLPYHTVVRASATTALTPDAMLAQVNGDKTLNSLIRFGGARVPGTPGYANILLENLVVKQEPYLDTVLYLDDPEPYLVHPDDIDEDETPDYTDNAILRVHPSFSTYRGSGSPGVNPYGFVGGPVNIYEDLIWTPVNRDFQLHKGLLQFDPVRAKYFKFEFTNLVPRPYATYAPVRRKVKMFSSITRREVRKRRVSKGGQADQAIKSSGADVNAALSATRSFSDQNRGGPPAPGYSQYTPVEGLYSADPAARDRLMAINPLYGQLPWHQGNMAPRFAETQRHVYEVVEVEHKDKIAFFVGLKQIRMGKVDYTVADDTPAYLWLFHDDTNLEGY